MTNNKKISVAVIGATGFTGEKLIDILLRHPKAEINYISAKIDEDLPYSEIFAAFKHKLEVICKNLDIQEAAEKCDVIFLALPHKISLEIAPLFLEKNKIVIDLSADYRLKDSEVYEKFYKIKHTDADNLGKAVYGLPEFYRKDIKNAKLIANPGCYPTVSILSAAPLLKEAVIEDIIIDAKSGITGAGRKAALEYHYAHLNGNLFGYKPFGHQHLPEIEQILSDISQADIKLRFTAHVIPVERGIFATIYAKLTKNISEADINDIYQKYYKNEPFVRVFGQKLPQLKDVVNTNFCDIGFQKQGQKIVIMSAIDNLVKGASGQAVQNMNIMLGFNETAGLL
jgi:N-acetyl-gamma-glutamyl-phosphate reductase